jgi:hypothetical protein
MMKGQERKLRALESDFNCFSEFLTGFRKRKNERRKKANDQIKQKGKTRRKEEQALVTYLLIQITNLLQKRKMIDDRLELIRNQRSE